MVKRNRQKFLTSPLYQGKPKPILHLSGICRDQFPTKGFKDIRVVFPITSAINSPIWPLPQVDGSWRLTVDYSILNQWVTLIVAVVLGMILLLKQIHIEPGAQNTAIDLERCFCLYMDQQDTRAAVCFRPSGTAVHNSDDIMLTGHDEQKVAIILDTLIRQSMLEGGR